MERRRLGERHYSFAPSLRLANVTRSRSRSSHRTHGCAHAGERHDGLTVALLGTISSTGREKGQSGSALFSVQIWSEKNQVVPRCGDCFGKRYAGRKFVFRYFGKMCKRSAMKMLESR